MIRRRLADALDRRFESLHHRVEAVARDVEQLAADVAGLQEGLTGIGRRLDEQLLPALSVVAGRDAESRRLLAEARADPAY